MPTTIDREVVEMRFDNTDFEKNAATSMSTLDKLKNAIKFENLAHPFSKITDTIKGVNFDPMLDGIQTVQSRFSMLDVAVATIVQNITNSVLGMARKIANDFVIAPVTTGFQEYETQINAVQTILSNTKSKGTTIDDVNKALDELNLYADKTIYNFTQMTDNIGRFTAAGLDLNTSVSAIQGIANLAAMSGSTSQQASTAMYQLSQALSSGTVKLQDWNSVVNAGMGGELFQEQLKMTSREMGEMATKMQAMYKELDPMGNKFEDTAKVIADKFNVSVKDAEDLIKNGYDFDVDALVEKEGGFRNSLSKGWITSTVLSKTLDRLTTGGAISYIGEHLKENSKYTIENVEAMYKEAMAAKDADAEIKKLAKTIASSTDLTEEQVDAVLNMAMTAEDAATKVKTFTQLIDTLKEAAQSGWTQSWEIIIGDFEEARTLWTEISDRLGGVISASAEARNNMLQAWADQGGRTMLIDSIRNLFDAIGSFTAPVKDVLDTIFPPMTAEKLLKITENFKAFTESLILNEEAQAQLKDTLGKLLEPFSWISKLIGGIVSKSAELGVFRDIWESVKNVAITLVNIFYAIANAVANVFFNKDLDGMEGFINSIAEGLKFITDKIRQFTEWIRLSSEETDKLSKIIEAILRVVTFVKKVIFEIFIRVAGFISEHIGALGELKDKILEIGSSIAEWVNQHVRVNEILNLLKDGFARIKEIASAAFEKISELLDKIKEKLSAIFKKDTATNDENGGGFLSGVINTLKNIGSFLKDKLGPLVSSVVEKLKTINWKTVFAGLVAALNWDNINKIIDHLFGDKSAGGIIGSLTENFFGPLKEALSGFGDVLSEFKNSIKINELIKISIAIAILAASLSALSKIDAEGMQTGLTGITALFAELISTAKLLSKGESINVKGLMTIAISVGILALSLSSLAKIDAKSLGGASSAIVALMTSLVIVAKLLSSADPKSMTQGIGSLILFAISISILASAVKKLAKLDPGNMVLALGAIMLLILTFTAVVKHLGEADLTSVAESATGMLLFAVAISILASAVKKLAKLDSGELIKGLAGVGALLLEMSLFLKTSNVGDIAGSAGGMLLFAAAVVIMAVAVKMLAKLKIEDLAIGLVGIGGILLAIGLFTKAVSGTKMIGIGTGLLIMSAAFVIMAAALKTLSTIDLESMAVGLVGIGGVLALLAIFSRTIKGSQLIAIGAGLLIVSVALVVISGALSIMSNISTEGMVKSLIAIGATLLMLSIALNAMKGTLAGSAALLIAAIALNALVPPMVILGQLSGRSIAKALIAIAGGLALLIIAGMGAQMVAGGLLALSASLLAMGAAVFLVGAGLALAGAGLTLIATAMLTFAINFTATLGIILAAIPALVKGLITFIKEFIVGLANAIAEIIPALKNIIVALIVAICDTVIETAPKIVQTLAVLIKLLLNALTQVLPTIIKFLGDFITNILDALITNIPVWVGKMIDIAIALIEGLGEGLAEAGPRFREALGKFLKGVLEFILGFFGIHSPSKVFAEIGVNLIEGLIEGLWSMFTTLLTDFGKFLGDIIEGVLEWVGDFLSAGAKLLGAFLDGIWSVAEDIWGACKDIAKKAWDWLVGNEEENFYKGGESLAKHFEAGIEGQSKPVSLTAHNMAEGAKNEIEGQASGFNAAGATLGANAALGLQSQNSFMASTGSGIASSGQAAVSAQSGNYNTAGSSLGASAVTGLGSHSGQMRTKGEYVARQGKEGAESLRGEYETTGGYLSDGLTVGFGAKVRQFIEKVRSSAAQADTAARNQLGVHSPSTVFAEIGRYTMEGFIVGIESYRNKVASTTADIGDESISAINSAIGALATISNEDLDANPVITPVLDLSNVENEAGRIPSLLDTLNTYQLASQNGSLIDVTANTKQGNTNTLFEEMVKLRSDFATLVNAINGLNIVMDSGVVVGELVGPMDEALGAKNIQAGRGVR
jgi:tape measure domain-containing protein